MLKDLVAEAKPRQVSGPKVLGVTLRAETWLKSPGPHRNLARGRSFDARGTSLQLPTRSYPRTVFLTTVVQKQIHLIHLNLRTRTLSLTITVPAVVSRLKTIRPWNSFYTCAVNMSNALATTVYPNPTTVSPIATSKLQRVNPTVAATISNSQPCQQRCSLYPNPMTVSPITGKVHRVNPTIAATISNSQPVSRCVQYTPTQQPSTSKVHHQSNSSCHH